MDGIGVKGLTFGDRFNQPIERLDLTAVKSLTFCRDFNQPVDLPLSLSYLYASKRMIAHYMKGRHIKNMTLIYDEDDE